MLLNINDVNLWCKTYGKNKDHAIILIGGTMQPSSYWDESFCRSLAKNHFVIIYDCRNFGYSSQFEYFDGGKPSLSDHVKDVKGLIDHYELYNVTIIGFSLGGIIAQLSVIQYREYIKNLIVINSPIIAKGDLEYNEDHKYDFGKLLKEVEDNMSFEDIDEGIKYLSRYRYLLHGSTEIDYKILKKYVKRLYESHFVYKKNINSLLIDINDLDIYEYLVDIDIPILFIHGKDDYLATHPDNPKMLSKAIKKSRCVLLDDVGHIFLNRKVWKKIGKEITDFTQV